MTVRGFPNDSTLKGSAVHDKAKFASSSEDTPKNAKYYSMLRFSSRKTHRTTLNTEHCTALDALFVSYLVVKEGEHLEGRGVLDDALQLPHQHPHHLSAIAIPQNKTA